MHTNPKPENGAPDNETLRTIKDNAEFVIEHLSNALVPFKFGYNAKSLQWVDAYINRLGSNGRLTDEQTLDAFTFAFGSFLGEAIIHNAGGKWKYIDGILGVFMPDGNSVYPMDKARKHLINGPDDSIYALYETILALPSLSEEIMNGA